MPMHDESLQLQSMLRQYADPPDPHAVRFARPGQAPLINPPPGNPLKARGPRRIDTLETFSSSTNQPSSTTPNRGAPPLRSRPAPGTVPATKRPFEAEPKSQLQNKIPKRRCLDIATASEVVNIADDSDELSTKSTSSARTSFKTRQKSDLITNKISGMLEQHRLETLDATSEYARVELRVCSKEYAKYKAVDDHKPPINTQFRVGSHYQGTARSRQCTEKLPIKSHHWMPQPPAENSRNMFHDENGLPRGSSPSEDELGHGPSDHYLSVQSAASMHKIEQTATIVPESQESLHEMEFEKSFPRTTFTNSSQSVKKSSSRSKPTRSTQHEQTFYIRHILSHRFTQIDIPCQIMFHSVNDEDVFEISVDDDLTDGKMGYKFSPQVINTAVWCQDSSVVHLKCSKTHNSSNSTITIDFINKDNSTRFVYFLQSRSYGRSKLNTPETLERIFATGLKLRNGFVTQPLAADGNQEMGFLQKKRAQSKQDQSSEAPQSWPPKRIKTTDRLTDRLTDQHAERLKDLGSRVASKVSDKANLSDHFPSDKLAGDKQNAPWNELSNYSFRDRRKIMNDPTDITKSQRNLPRTRARSTQSFVVPDEPPQPLGYSKTVGLGEPWEKPLVYPPEGKKKSTVEWSDLEKLDEGEYLNDNLLGFYLRYLETQLEQCNAEVAKTVYWFNTYFYTSLTQNVRGKGKINYDAVRKWTRSVDLFSYDYVVIPINENHHWYLAIICNLPALKRAPMPLTDDDDEILDKGESEASKHSGQRDARNPTADDGHEDEADPPRHEITPNEQLTRESFAEMQIDDAEQVAPPEPAQDVTQEGKEHVSQDEVLEIFNTEDSKGITLLQSVDKKVAITSKVAKGKRKLKFDPDFPTIMTLDSLMLAHSVTIKILKTYLQDEAKDKRGCMTWDEKAIRGMTAQEIPHQENYWDCGLYVLGYASKFMANPREFVVKMCSREYDQVEDWPALNPSNMRNSTRELIFGLHKEQHPKFHVKSEASPKVAPAPEKQHEAQTPMPARKVGVEEGAIDGSPKHIEVTEPARQINDKRPPERAKFEKPPSWIKAKAEDPLKQIAAKAEEPPRQIKIELPIQTNQEGHSNEVIKASPEPPAIPKVCNGEKASQAIPIDDGVVEAMEAPPKEEPKEMSPKKIPGAFDDETIEDDDDTRVMVPDSQEG